MSSLTVYHENQPEQPLKLLTHAEDIASTLAEVGVRFERWEAAAPIAAGASQDEVIAAYAHEIERLKRERGYITVDEHPHFVAVRLFNNPEGWVAQFTGDDIASRFPLLED